MNKKLMLPAHVCMTYHAALYYKQKNCTYNVTLKCVPAATFGVEKQEVLNVLKVCVCSFRYPACSAHVPYYHMWTVWVYNIFTPYFINDNIFEKKKMNMQYVFWISLQPMFLHLIS